MSLKLGNDDVAKVMLGSTDVSAVYKGSDEVWSAGGGPIENISEVFSTYLYRGTGAARDIENGVDLAGEGGMVWTKNRYAARAHALYDSERGPGWLLKSNAAEQSKTYPDSLASFNSDGFSLGSDGSMITNVSGENYASWTFRKQPGFFDIVTYTGTSTTQVIPHNLGSTPGMIIIKCTSAAKQWQVYHRSIGATASLTLNEDWTANTNNGFYNGTEPTDTEFTVHTSGNVNSNGQEYVAYLFAHDDSDESSLIKCGGYTGTGAAGNEIELGWEPQFVFIKSATSNDSWLMLDSGRGMEAGQKDPYLVADAANAEAHYDHVGLSDKGFILQNAGPQINGLGSEYVYMAIKADPNFFMLPEWEQMNQEVAKKIAKRESVKEVITEKAKNLKDIKDDS